MAHHQYVINVNVTTAAATRSRRRNRSLFLFVCLFVFYKGRPDQNQAQEQGSAAQCGFSRVNVRAAEYVIKTSCSKYVDGGH